MLNPLFWKFTLLITFLFFLYMFVLREVEDEDNGEVYRSHISTNKQPIRKVFENVGDNVYPFSDDFENLRLRLLQSIEHLEDKGKKLKK